VDFEGCQQVVAKVFEMSILRKIDSLTRRHHIRNVDMLIELAVDKDSVEMQRRRRLSYFGDVA